MANYKTEAEALAGAGVPGWSVTGREQEYENITTKDENNQNVTTKRPTGNTILTVQSPDGSQHDSITVGSGDDATVKGGKVITVVKGAQQSHPVAATSTPASGLERLDENLNVIPPGSSTPTVYVRDPKAPPGTQPFKVDPNVKTDPSTWTPITDPNDKSDNPRVIGLWDPANNKVGASVSAQAGAKTSDPGKWTPVYRTPGDSGSGVVGQWDPVNSELHAVSSAPDGTQIVATPTAIYTLDKATGKVINTQEVAQGDVNKQAVSSGGKIYVFDPKTGTLTLPDNVQAAATVGNSTTLKDLVWYDDQGNEVSRTPNPNYGKAPVTAPTPNTVAPYIQVPDPQNPSQLIWIENKGQVTASAALQQLAAHLTGQVVDKKISVDEAKTLIDAANQRMTADTAQTNAETAQQQNVTTAAGDILSNTRGNAQTGAGLLQQRAQTASGMLQNILGQATGAKNLMSAPAGLGEQLVGGIGGWTADMMGGQSTLDSAARMVQMADPSSNMADPATQTAVGVLQQMLDKYHQVTGSPHPAVAATNAAQQSAQNGGLTAPVTTTTQQTQPAPPVQQRTTYGGLAQGGANMGGMNLYPTPGSPGMPISGLAQGGLQGMPGFVAPGAPVKPPPITVTVG
jgi:hypothetical protein